MRNFDEKFFWFTNLVAPWIIGGYFVNNNSWLGIIVPAYCVIYWLCAMTYLGHHHK